MINAFQDQQKRVEKPFLPLSATRLNLFFEQCRSESESNYLSPKNVAYFVKFPEDSCTFGAIFLLILQLRVFLQAEEEFHFKAQTSWQKMCFSEGNETPNPRPWAGAICLFTSALPFSSTLKFQRNSRQRWEHHPGNKRWKTAFVLKEKGAVQAGSHF